MRTGKLVIAGSFVKMIIYTIFAFLCSLLYSLSSVLCKYGLQHDVDIRSLPLPRLAAFLARNKIWLLGVLLAVIANIAMIQIQSRLDVSIVYTILNFSYIFVLVLGHYYLHESLTEYQWLGVVVVAMGTLMILGIQEKTTGEPTDVANLLNMTSVSLMAIIVLVFVGRYNKSINYEIPFAISAGICFGLVETYLKATTNMVTGEEGGFSVFSLQDMRDLVSVWPFFVMFFYGALGWLFLQITYSHGNVSVTVPLVAVSQRMVSMFSGYYVYDEFFGLVKWMGVFSILLGISIMVVATLRVEEPKTV
jgi:drug/metabolite transporter (DMT)-like permease